jgi:hypothetical protein
VPFWNCCAVGRTVVADAHPIIASSRLIARRVNGPGLRTLPT